MTQSTNNLAAYIWSLADLLRGDFKQSQCGRITLPFTLLHRFEGVLAQSKEAHENQMIQLLIDPLKAAGFARRVFDLLKCVAV